MIIYVLSWRFLSRKVAKIKIWASKNVAALLVSVIFYSSIPTFCSFLIIIIIIIIIILKTVKPGWLISHNI